MWTYPVSLLTYMFSAVGGSLHASAFPERGKNPWLRERPKVRGLTATPKLYLDMKKENKSENSLLEIEIWGHVFKFLMLRTASHSIDISSWSWFIVFPILNQERHMILYQVREWSHSSQGSLFNTVTCSRSIFKEKKLNFFYFSSGLEQLSLRYLRLEIFSVFRHYSASPWGPFH